MTGTTHRIRRQRWVVHTTSAGHAFELRQRLRADWAERLQPAFELAFAEVNRAGVTLHIPKIELRFKLPAGEKMLERLPELIQRQLTEQLRDALRPERDSDRTAAASSLTTTQSQFESLLAYLRTGLLNWEAAGAAKRPAEELKQTCRQQWELLQTHLSNHQESAAFYFRLWRLTDRDSAPTGEATRQVTPETQFEDLLAYLRTGWLHWTVPISGGRPLVEFKEICRQQWLRIVDHLRHNSEAAPFYDRLRQILEQEERRTLVRLVTQGLPESWIEPASCILIILLTGSDGILEPEVRRQLAAAFEVELLQYHGSTQQPAVTSPLPAGLPGTSAPYFRSLAEYDLPAAQQSALAAFVALQSPAAARWLETRNRPQTKPAAVTAAMGRGIPASGPATPGDPAATTTVGGQARTAVATAPQLAVRPPSSTRSATSGEPLPLTVFLAGLVLLHPYIPRYLAARGLPWVPQQPFTGLELARAAALLYNLARAEEDIQEYELGFIKVLLGLTPETPLCVGPGWVTGDDRTEAQALLASVIAHWTALKNTTPDGLRAAFLSRTGLLHQDENGWRLQFERTGVDVLLDRLPWGISVVKLPWMNLPIYVEW